jgi:uncharacterized sporulation protein YeaH/YhbH (DUF444 family)
MNVITMSTTKQTTHLPATALNRLRSDSDAEEARRAKIAKEALADRCYELRHLECQDLLKRIAKQLAKHQKEQAADPRNWGFPGDLGHVNEELALVLASLGDTSAVEAKGMEY